MSSALDKSLDEIISTNKKVNKSKVSKAKAQKKAVNKPRPAGVGKKAVSTKKPVSFKKPAAPAAPAAPTIDLTQATKVVVYGLPKDTKNDAIKDFFQSQVGAVQNVALSYNERGQFKGIATIIFKTHKSAALAVTKFNGAPIDGGSSKLRLELIIDPTKKSLSSRITPVVQDVAIAKAQQAKAKHNKKNGSMKPLAVKANGAKSKPNGPKAVAGQKKATKKPAKKEKKTLEQLDQEMADYFGN